MDTVTVHEGFTPRLQRRPHPRRLGGRGLHVAGRLSGGDWRRSALRPGRRLHNSGRRGFGSGNGFGSFSKAYGSAAASLIEAEIVTADGVTRIVNNAQEPDLFWALKGGGGGTFGIVTRLTLATHPLPDTFGSVNSPPRPF